MILRLLIAFSRWTWGISPAFYTIKQPISVDDVFLIVFGTMIDMAAIALSTVWITLLIIKTMDKEREK